jgi:High potential iron-sulfur protein
MCGLAACGRQTEPSASQATVGAKSALCVNPDELSDGDRSLMATAHYVEASTVASQSCGNCGLFNGAAPGSECGRCDIFQRSVNSHGHCDNWSARSS